MLAPKREKSDTPENNSSMSISGTKYTSARIVARQALEMAFPASNTVLSSETPISSEPSTANGIFDYGWMPEPAAKKWISALANLQKNESVVHLDDLILRRTNLGDNPDRALTLAPQLCKLFDWDDARSAAEIQRLEAHFQWFNREAVYE